VGKTGPVSILGIPGSLRQASYNKAALSSVVIGMVVAGCGGASRATAPPLCPLPR
jgi:hypothetical protein